MEPFALFCDEQLLRKEYVKIKDIAQLPDMWQELIIRLVCHYYCEFSVDDEERLAIAFKTVYQSIGIVVAIKLYYDYFEERDWLHINNSE